MPAIYNQNLARYNWNPPEPTPNSVEVQLHALINVKLEHENTQLKETITQLQNRIGAEDLTTSEMADLQETLMADDDDDESFHWLNITRDNLPAPIGSVKVENESMDDLELASPEVNYSEVENIDLSPNVTAQQNGSDFEPIASTSCATSSPNRQQDTSAVVMDLHHNDKVAGSVEFILNVRNLCHWNGICCEHCNNIYMNVYIKFNLHQLFMSTAKLRSLFCLR